MAKVERDRSAWAMGFNSIHRMRDKLEWEISELNKTSAKIIPGGTELTLHQVQRPMYTAANAAITAWHMADWLAYHVGKMNWWDKLAVFGDGRVFRKSDDILKWLREEPAMKTCHAMCLALKHVRLTSLPDLELEVKLIYEFWDSRDNGCPKSGDFQFEGIFLRQNLTAVFISDGQRVTRDIREVLSKALIWWDDVLGRLPPEREWLPRPS